MRRLHAAEYNVLVNLKLLTDLRRSGKPLRKKADELDAAGGHCVSQGAGCT